MNTGHRKEIHALHYRSGKPMKITVAGNRFESIEAASDEPAGMNSPPEALPMVGPGLVDLQINGYMGIDFNHYPVSPRHLSDATRLLQLAGVTSYYPTVTTSSDEYIEDSLKAIAAACSTDAECADSIAGIHLEGPFISPEDGARGAHLARYTKAPDWELLQRWQNAAKGKIRIVTMSPEWPGSTAFIEKCMLNGITVSIGHTSASPEQIREAAAAGARMSTHLGNGAHLMLPRHPNYIWEQLADDSLHACLIPDGFHVPLSFLKVVLKVKGPLAMLVSDAVSLSGLPPGAYRSHGRIDVIKTEQGRLHLADQPQLLAGSAQLLPWGIGHLARSGVCSLADAWDMSSIRPAAFMDLPSQAGLEAGAPADFVLFHWTGEQVHIRKTFKNGTERSG
ncbi:N-acetylglucosamine-6-phosphate deacetylase [Paenibacillus sp. GCM10012303]|uniref:N-acetylglucosamine-6-phosphate deacetylase n=1 Tax=Paenibacillus sp. GCM10012303 TaxID=3317340 RepID=UPI00360BD181